MYIYIYTAIWVTPREVTPTLINVKYPVGRGKGDDHHSSGVPSSEGSRCHQRPHRRVRCAICPETFLETAASADLPLNQSTNNTHSPPSSVGCRL